MKEVVSMLTSFVIPEAGILIMDALWSIGKLVNEMQENEQICRRVFDRMTFVKEELDKIVDVKTLRDSRILIVYGENISNFLKFLKKQYQKSLIKRLASNRKVIEAIEEFHKDMDELYKLLNISHITEMATWRQEYKEDQMVIHQQLKDLVANVNVIVQEVQSPQFTEGLAWIKYELEQKHNENQPEHRELLQQTICKLLRTSGAKMPKAPAWFIRSDDVEFDVVDEKSGTFGSVHWGTWGKGATVVLKTLLIDDVKSKKSFFKEVEVWKDLNNPHVIRLYGACHVSTPAFFVCEDAVHGNFANYFQQDKSKIWQLFHQAACGLDYLHRNKVVHGNLKCNNILVGADGKAKISDFGFAFIRSQSVGLSAKAQSDSIRWKAPECLMPGGDEVDAAHNPRFASDVYSFGMCLIEAFSDATPYEVEDDDEIMGRIFLGKSYPRPYGLQDDEWALIQSLCHPKWKQRISLADAIAKLKTFADRERNGTVCILQEISCSKCQDRILQEISCSNCQDSICSIDRFCRHCGSPNKPTLARAAHNVVAVEGGHVPVPA
ncbi:Tyrosine-protein kinase Srms [Phytophthora citrophthora]|uniref:Tyrosine-protein kinase Srms n=1 Tax=Phytophthora citrophthora TaxID=4793 RepID=A0AAD9GPT8_9STRA|nr:Tyrosine-protein kinase Srms [Phytophthora citrophthora]